MQYRAIGIPLILLLLVYQSEGYDFNLVNSEGVSLESIEGNFAILENDTLNSGLRVVLFVPKFYHQNITLIFHPGEHINNAPIEILDARVCWTKCEYLKLNKQQYLRKFVYENQEEDIIYAKYNLTFLPEIKNQSEFYTVLINYNLPKFVFKQGDFKIAHFYVSNLGQVNDKLITNTIYLPTQFDIPRFIPDNVVQIYRESDENFTNYRWAFVFEGRGDKIIWYQNDKEIKEQNLLFNKRIALYGAFIGLMLTFLFEYFKSTLNEILNFFKKKKR